MTKEVRVKPQMEGEHVFEPATYSFKLDGETRLVGTSSNKPKVLEVLSKRDFILSESWHIEHWVALNLFSLLTVGLPFVLWYQTRSAKNSSTD